MSKLCPSGRANEATCPISAVSASNPILGHYGRETRSHPLEKGRNQHHREYRSEAEQYVGNRSLPGAHPQTQSGQNKS